MSKTFIEQIQRQYKKGFQMGGFYWTVLMMIALYNLRDFTKEDFDEIEKEMGRLDEEMKKVDKPERQEQLFNFVQKLRGTDYVNECLKGVELPWEDQKRTQNSKNKNSL